MAGVNQATVTAGSEVAASGKLRGTLSRLALPALALSAAGIIWLATPWGIGVEYDSVFYWSAAENLLHGRGLGRLDGAGELIPLTHFPPLYPLALAGVAGLSGNPVTEAARWLSAAFFGLNVYLLGHSIRALGAGSWLAAGAALFGMLSPTLVERHLWAMSEPMYFALLLCSLLCLVRSMEGPDDRWLMASGTLAGLAALTRYAGISILATGILICLAWGSRRTRERLRRAALFALPAATLPALWQLRNLLVVGTPANRVLRYHPVSLDQLREAGSTLAGWLPYPFLPAELRAAVLTIAALGALGLLVRAARTGQDRPGDQAWRLACVAGVHGAVYIAFLLVSLSFFDASTRLRDRILSPLFLVGLLMAACLLAIYWSRWTAGLRIAAVGVAAVLVLPYGSSTWLRVAESRSNGLGFVGQAWRDSETMQLVRRLPNDLLLYSNEAFPIYFLAGRPAYWVPEQLDPVKGEPRLGYREDLAAMHSAVRGDEAALVLFHPDSLRPELPSLDELTDELRLISATGDGAVYLGR